MLQLCWRCVSFDKPFLHGSLILSGPWYRYLQCMLSLHCITQICPLAMVSGFFHCGNLKVGSLLQACKLAPVIRHLSGKFEVLTGKWWVWPDILTRLTADYPQQSIFVVRGKNVQQITRTGLLPTPQNQRKSCYCIIGIRTHKLGAMNIPWVWIPLKPRKHFSG